MLEHVSGGYRCDARLPGITVHVKLPVQGLPEIVFLQLCATYYHVVDFIRAIGKTQMP